MTNLPCPLLLSIQAKGRTVLRSTQAHFEYYSHLHSGKKYDPNARNGPFPCPCWEVVLEREIVYGQTIQSADGEKSLWIMSHAINIHINVERTRFAVH